MAKYIDADLLRKEIERLKDEYTDIAIDSRRGWVNANSVIDDLEQLQFQIDSLQQKQPEKPIPKDLDFEQELYNHFGQIRDFTLGMRIGQYFYNLGRDSVPLPEDTVLFQKGVAEGKRLMMEDYPKWHKVQRGSCFDKYTNFLLLAREGHFYCSSMEVPRDGYILLVDELERLPKED